MEPTEEFNNLKEELNKVKEELRLLKLDCEFKKTMDLRFNEHDYKTVLDLQAKLKRYEDAVYLIFGTIPKPDLERQTNFVYYGP